MEGLFMSFENGYNIMDYIGDSIEKYNEDNCIFEKALKLLNIYMGRSDWPYCYEEYSELVEDTLGFDCDWISKYYGQFSSQAKQGHELLKEWDKDIPELFKREWIIFSKVIRPIIEQYYNYINNPLGIKKLVKINSDIMKIVRIERNDGKFLDLNLHNRDIEQLSNALIEFTAEG
jgi:hypothetical protein